MNTQERIEITPQHRNRLAITYVRTACMPQTPDEVAAVEHQRAQAWHARAWGWPDTAIQVIEDLGRGGHTAENREGYLRLYGQLAAGKIGMVLVTDEARIARSAVVFAQFLDICRQGNTLLAVGGHLVSPRDPMGLLYERLLRVAGSSSEDCSHIRHDLDCLEGVLSEKPEAGANRLRSRRIREIFRSCSAGGMTLAEIAEALNNGGLKTTGPA